jgi:hypothetical protein
VRVNKGVLMLIKYINKNCNKRRIGTDSAIKGKQGIEVKAS